MSPHTTAGTAPLQSVYSKYGTICSLFAFFLFSCSYPTHARFSSNSNTDNRHCSSFTTAVISSVRFVCLEFIILPVQSASVKSFGSPSLKFKQNNGVGVIINEHLHCSGDEFNLDHWVSKKESSELQKWSNASLMIVTASVFFSPKRTCILKYMHIIYCNLCTEYISLKEKDEWMNNRQER